MCHPRRRNKSLANAPRSAFTLIELLIVVAIISVLAVIATPNFLEAQTRSKISRAKSDLRVLAVALESYAADHNVYPLAADEAGRPIIPYPPIGLGPEVFETRLSSLITTPVAYLSSLALDPFASRRPDEEDPRIIEAPGYHYGLGRYAEANDGPDGLLEFQVYVQMMGGQPHTIQYYVSSHGPDLDHDDDEVLSDIEAAVPYDPTNGSISSGDVVRFGPSAGFGK